MSEHPLPNPANARTRDTHRQIGMERIRAVVDDFYNEVQTHPALAETFAVVDDWPEHKAKIAHFWWVSLGGERYRDDEYRVGPVHARNKVREEQVDEWLKLFRTVLEKHLEPELVEAWYARANNMGRSIRMIARFGESPESASAAILGRPVAR